MLTEVFDRILCNMYPDEHAAIVKIADKWYMVVSLQHNTKYFYSAHLMNGTDERIETLTISHPIVWITESQVSDYGITLE